MIATLLFNFAQPVELAMDNKRIILTGAKKDGNGCDDEGAMLRERRLTTVFFC